MSVETKELSPAETVDTIRFANIVARRVSDFQLNNLKMAPLVFFGENLTNEVSIDFDKSKISFTLTGASDYKPELEEFLCEAMVTNVRTIIGQYEVNIKIGERNLMVENVYVPSNSAKPSRTEVKSSKRKGKKSLRKIPKRK